MFNAETVFILGAGASWHYGYPTGEDLVEKVTEKATELQNYALSVANINFPECGSAFFSPPNFISPKDHRKYSTDVSLYRKDWKNVAEQLSELRTKLMQSHPLVIDYFLEQNESIRTIGKLLIAWVILECEAVSKQKNIDRKPRKKGEKPPKDNWYRYIVNQLAQNAKISNDLFNNHVHFITFNYDTSLEQHLYSSLSHIDLFDEQDIKKFISERVIHIYGKISDNLDAQRFPEPNTHCIYLPQDRPENKVPQFNMAYEASKLIRTINGTEKENTGIIEKSKTLINKCSRLYILGYGFDHMNNKRLELGTALRCDKNNYKNVFFTNFDDSNIVNKRISHLIWGHQDNGKSFMPPNPYSYGNNRRPPYYEKSIRDVYQAFERDFDLQG